MRHRKGGGPSRRQSVCETQYRYLFLQASPHTNDETIFVYSLTSIEAISDRVHLDFLVQPIGKRFSSRFKIVMRLEIHPELCFHLEEAAESQGRIGRDPSLTMDNLIDAARRNANGLSQAVLTYLHRLQEILQQDFTGMYGWEVSLGHSNHFTMSTGN